MSQDVIDAISAQISIVQRSVASEQRHPHASADLSDDLIRDGHAKIGALRRIRTELENLFTDYIPDS